MFLPYFGRCILLLSCCRSGTVIPESRALFRRHKEKARGFSKLLNPARRQAYAAFRSHFGNCVKFRLISFSDQTTLAGCKENSDWSVCFPDDRSAKRAPAADAFAVPTARSVEPRLRRTDFLLQNVPGKQPLVRTICSRTWFVSCRRERCVCSGFFRSVGESDHRQGCFPLTVGRASDVISGSDCSQDFVHRCRQSDNQETGW